MDLTLSKALVGGLVGVSELLAPLHRNRASRQLDAYSQSARALAGTEREVISSLYNELRLRARSWPFACVPRRRWRSALASTSPGGPATRRCSGWSKLIWTSSSAFTPNGSLGLTVRCDPSSSECSGTF
jgi:hypothetical protein